MDWLKYVPYIQSFYQPVAYIINTTEADTYHIINIFENFPENV